MKRHWIRNAVLIALAVMAWGAGMGLTAGLWHAWYGTIDGGLSEWFASTLAWPIVLPALVVYRLVGP